MPPTPDPPITEQAEPFRPKSLAPDYVAQIERLETVIPSMAFMTFLF